MKSEQKLTRKELQKKLVDKINPYCNLFITVGLVPYGYQIDFYNDKGESVGMACHDFSGDYTMKSLELCTIAALDKAMSKMENDCKKYLKRNK